MQRLWIPIVLFLFAARAFAQQEFPSGKTTDPVALLSDSSQSYALYLPSAYDPAKKWPILYCFDASATGIEPLELFREAAEKHGYIIASSNNSQSDDPTVPNLQIVKGIWEDTHQRLAIDETRVYATGFSGGARIACDMGYQYPVAGVIGVGAGFPTGRPPAPDMPFVYFGTIGTRDFNYYEMRLLENRLEAAKLAHRIRSFDGVHQWPPQPVCAEAIEWMELQAMKKNLRAKDAGLVQSFLKQRMSSAESLEAAGNKYDAAIRYGEIAADFGGLIDVSPAQKKSQELMDTDAYRAAADAWSRRDKESNEFGLKLVSVTRSIREGSRVPALETVKAFLDIDNLKKRAADSSNIEDSQHAFRLLSLTKGQCSFYLPRTFFERGDYAKAALVLSLAVDINPQANWTWYYLATAYAQLGEKKKGLEALAKAVDSGFDDTKKMETDFDLKSLREEKEFRKILDRAKKP